MPIKHLFFILTVICMLLLPSAVRAQQDEPQVVNIPDPNLAAAIKNATGENTITTHTMLALRRLSASHHGIEDLTGLEHAHNLRILLLPDNNISDLSPLAELKNLVSLDLQNNNISDVSPLVGLINLKPHGGFYSALNIQSNLM
ncbi:MAG: leucine-rich repeat domain-containing protein [Candidatus Poribacteria bacterium]|nr:leucine-rich repeat domain-containing protein [Candidatus Poribacteria bacterium]